MEKGFLSSTWGNQGTNFGKSRKGIQNLKFGLGRIPTFWTHHTDDREKSGSRVVDKNQRSSTGVLGRGRVNTLRQKGGRCPGNTDVTRVGGGG